MKKKDNTLKQVCDSIDMLLASMDTISKKDFVKDNDLIRKKKAELMAIGKLGQNLQLRETFSDIFLVYTSYNSYFTFFKYS